MRDQPLALCDADVRSAIEWTEVLASTRAAYAEFSRGDAINPLRTRLYFPGGARQAIMPAYSTRAHATGTKLVGYYPSNEARGWPKTVGTYVATDPESGALTAIIDATALTSIRTAGSAVTAIDVLAADNWTRLGLIGSGALAQDTAAAVAELFHPEQVVVFSRREHRREAFAADLRSRAPSIESVYTADSAESVLGLCDVVVCATDTTVPLFDGSKLTPQHLTISIGANTRTTRELDTATILRSTLVGDSRESLESECGEVLLARDEGHEVNVYAEIGELIERGETIKPGGRSVVFKAAGIAIQDVVLADVIIRSAIERGLGTRFRFNSSFGD